MRSVQVKAETRAIRDSLNDLKDRLDRSTWTRELAADLESYHNIDLDKELAHLLSEEVRKMRASNRKKSINKIFQN